MQPSQTSEHQSAKSTPVDSRPSIARRLSLREKVLIRSAIKSSQSPPETETSAADPFDVPEPSASESDSARAGDTTPASPPVVNVELGQFERSEEDAPVLRTVLMDRTETSVTERGVPPKKSVSAAVQRHDSRLHANIHTVYKFRLVRLRRRQMANRLCSLQHTRRRGRYLCLRCLKESGRTLCGQPRQSLR